VELDEKPHHAYADAGLFGLVAPDGKIETRPLRGCAFFSLHGSGLKSHRYVCFPWLRSWSCPSDWTAPQVACGSNVHTVRCGLDADRRVLYLFDENGEIVDRVADVPVPCHAWAGLLPLIRWAPIERVVARFLAYYHEPVPGQGFTGAQ
jgi:hypothetical protein